MKKHDMIRAVLFGFALCVAAIAGGCHDEPSSSGAGGSNPPATDELQPPTIRLQYIDGKVWVDWKSVEGAASYGVYVLRGHWGTASFVKERTVTSTYFTDEPQYPGNFYYYKVTSIDRLGNESKFSNEVVFLYREDGGSTGGGDDTPGGGDNPPGGDEADVPSVPTGVRAENVGSSLLPEVRVSWNAVSGADSYEVYRSQSSYGTYSLLGSTVVTHLSDFRPYEGSNYYKVKAVNAKGKSGYSSYAVYSNDPSSAVAPCPVRYGNCSVSGTTMTLRWTVSSSFGCGKPDKGYLRVRNPNSGEYADVQTLSANATSASFNYLPWVDDNGYVYAGIILENAKGTSGGTPKIYDTNSRRWMN